jgi:diaminopimelate decarboxylase
MARGEGDRSRDVARRQQMTDVDDRDRPDADRLAELAPGLRAAASRYGTPLYVTDAAGLERSARSLAAAFPDPWFRTYSLKANDVPAIVARVVARGIGANVVSRGELALARRAGVPSSATTLEGVGKTDADLRAAVAASAAGDPLRWVAVESFDELTALDRLASRAGLGRAGRAPLEILLRLNPAVRPETHRGLAVGDGSSKFGFSGEELTSAAELASSRPALMPRGIHLHVGSQLATIDAWRDGVRKGLALLALIRGASSAFDTLDVGGGFPVGTGTPSIERFAAVIPGLLDAVPADRRPARMAVEPGRFLVAEAGWLVARVLHVRDRGGPMVVLDAGMTELIRPALYGIEHPVVALGSARRSGPVSPTRVEGPICESTDSLGTHPLPSMRRGDLVAIRDVGAYGSVLGSSYNGRPRPPQVILEPDGSLVLARRRGSVASLA